MLLLRGFTATHIADPTCKAVTYPVYLRPTIVSYLA
jgi:hypothetical protein